MFQIEEVRAEIKNAFGNLPVPGADEVLNPNWEITEENEYLRETIVGRAKQNFKESIVGRTWQELTPEFLSEKWLAFSDLSAVGFRYYIQALLIHSLDYFQIMDEDEEENEWEENEWEENEDSSEEELLEDKPTAYEITHQLMRGSLSRLSPFYLLIHMEGKDDYFIERTSVFSREQYAAICSFLGLALERLPKWERFDAARALYYGWNQHPHPAQDLVKSFYYDMHHFAWPESKHPAVRQLIGQIREAFKDTPYPVEIDGNETKSQGWETPKVVMAFRGQNWRTLHPDFLMEHLYNQSPALIFLPESAFRYFIPAFIILDLMMDELDPDSDTYLDEPVRDLTHHLADDESESDEQEDEDEDFVQNEQQIIAAEAKDRKSQENRYENSWYAYAVKKFSVFSPPERRAIETYLRFALERTYQREDKIAYHRTKERCQITQALERYWSK